MRPKMDIAKLALVQKADKGKDDRYLLRKMSPDITENVLLPAD